MKEKLSIFVQCALKYLGWKTLFQPPVWKSLSVPVIKNIQGLATIKFWSFLDIKFFSKSAGLKAKALQSLQKLLSYG